MTELSEALISRMREAALAVVPEKRWWHEIIGDGWGNPDHCVVESETDQICVVNDGAALAKATHMAASCPANVLALITEIERLTEALAAAERERDEADTERTDMMWQRRRADERAEAAETSLAAAQADLRAERQRVARVVEKIVEALKPFAEEYEQWSPEQNAGCVILDTEGLESCVMDLSVGDLRRAAHLLSELTTRDLGDAWEREANGEFDPAKHMRTCAMCGATAVAFICDRRGCPENGGAAYAPNLAERGKEGGHG